jgi:hypothetical protein
MSKRIAAILLVAACAAPAYALMPGDGVVVEFKDGSSMTGVLVKQGRKKIHLDFGGAEMSFGLDTVKSVKPKDNDVKKFQDMVKAAGDDFDGLLAAARFARAKGLDTYYDQLVARLGLPNQRSLDDAAENAAVAERQKDAADANNAAQAKLGEEQGRQDAAEAASRAEEERAEAAARKAWHEQLEPQKRLKKNAKRESESIGGGDRDEHAKGEHRDDERRDGGGR